MKLKLTTLLLSLCGLISWSQSNITDATSNTQENTSVNSHSAELKKINISGKVIDSETNAPLEYATVAFFSKKQNKIITGGITDLEGNFNIEIQSGLYDVSVEFMTYKTKTFSNQNLTETTNLGTISLELDIEALDAVEIIAEKTTVELKLDKKIYNVGKDLTVRGGSVSDVLDNVPSVSVDVEGNVALRGNDNVRILINGKPSGLVGLSSTEALRQLPAESIERVEVITAPSSRYDAEGTAGILNIILRRSKLQGLNGALTANIGHPTTAGISGNLNYRTGDFNFFTTTGYSYREAPGNSTTKTQYFNETIDETTGELVDNPDTYLNEYRDFDRERKGFNINTGVEWYVNDKASITASVVYRDNNNSTNTTNSINELDANGQLLNQTFRFDPELEDDKTIQYSLNFDKQFESTGHKLTLDFQFEDSKEDEFSTIQEDGLDIEKVSTIESQERVLLQTDYVLPIGENSQFEFGYRGNFNTLDTDYSLAFNENGEFIEDSNVSNNLIYTEHINAVYTQYGSKIKSKFSYLLGVRMEDTRIKINQVTSGDYDTKNYTEFFPTVNLAYELSEDQSFTLGYNRRIRRPRSRFINPFPSRSSATNIFQGNADIDPSYSNTLDLGYLNKMNTVTVNSSIYYTKSTDVFTFISEDTGETVFVGETEVPVIRRTPINLATNERYGFEFTLGYRPSRKFNINGNFNLFKSITRGDYNDTNFDADNLSWQARVNAKYTLPAKIDWQTRLGYYGPSEDAQNKRNGIFSCDLAFSKDLFKEKASIALNVRDVFNSRKRTIESTTDTFFSDSEFQWRQRSFNLSFTYRFNQKKSRSNQNRGGNGGDMDFEG